MIFFKGGGRLTTYHNNWASWIWTNESRSHSERGVLNSYQEVLRLNDVHKSCALPLGDSPLFNLQQINLCTIRLIIDGVCR